jgi:outer membrane protein assembly factor BamA
VKRVIAFALVAACGGSPAPTETIPLDQKPPTPSVVEWSKLVGPIKTVDVSSPDATLVAHVKEAVASVVSKPLDRAALRIALTNTLALQGVAEVSARGTQLADGIQLTIDVVPEPTLQALAAREVGGADLPLPGQLTSAIGLPVDPALLDALGVQLRDQYLAKGYTAAAVEWKQTPAGSGAVDVAVEVTPGKASIITAVDFKGNAHVKKADLIKAIGDGFAPSSPWNTDVITRGSLLVSGYYYDHGYVNVAVEEPPPPGQPGPAVYTISEGDQFRLGKLEVTGVPAADAKKYLGMIKLKQGEIFNRTAISDGLTKINQALGDSGQFVAPVTNIDTKKKVIDIKFDVTKL